MADRRLRTLGAILAVVAVLMAIWWIDRGRDRSVHRVAGPAPVVALPAVELSWIADATERAAVAAVCDAIDRGGPFARPTDGAIYADLQGHLPRQAPDYWRAYAVPGADARLLVAGPHHDIYYSRDFGQSFVAVRGALP